jgi:hypothetical protein
LLDERRQTTHTRTHPDIKTKHQPRDAFAVLSPRSLADVWALQLPRAPGAGGRAFLVNPKARQLVEADAAAVPALLERRLEYRAKAVLLVTVRVCAVVVVVPLLLLPCKRDQGLYSGRTSFVHPSNQTTNKKTLHNNNQTQARAWPVGERRGSDARVHLLQLQAHGSAPLAVALRIEYAPASCREAAAPVLDDLAAALQRSLDAGGGGSGGSLEPLHPRWEDWAAWLPPEFGAAHEALLYFDLVVAALRARGGGGGGGANAAGGVPRAAAAGQQQQQKQQQQQQQQQLRQQQKPGG